MLSRIFILSSLIVGTTSTIAIRRSIESKTKRWKENYGFEILDYCLSRTIVICPKCQSMLKVSNLDEQLNVDWQCNQCGASWEETPTHDVRKDL